MIINTSRIHQIKECETKAWFWNEQRLKALREDQNLLTGGGLHKALAVINSKAVQTVEQAADAAEEEFKTRIGESWDKLLPEEKKLYEEDIRALRCMVKQYGEHYLHEPYQMLSPEITFRVPLPGSEHHCWYVHRLLHPEDPDHNLIMRSGYYWNNGLIERKCSDPRCRQPHYFTGTTDAVIVWNRIVYLLEHKTTAYDLYNGSAQSRHYLQAWQLNDQATGYIYGIWKQTKVRPHGVLLNCIIKPRKNAANPTYNFYREAFLRTDADLERFEKHTIRTADHYEQTMRMNNPTLNPSSCYNYNRECYYRRLCLEHRTEPISGEFQPREADYVEQGYYKILGMEVPTK